jgi:hypothetical protein
MAAADLRPMTLGEVLDRTFTLYREHFLLFIGITALPYLLLLVFNFSSLALGLAADGHHRATSMVSPGMIGGVVAGAIGGGFLFLLIIGVAHAATVAAVSDLYLGRETNVRAAYSRAKGRIVAVLVVIVLSFLAVVVGMLFFIIPGIYLACRLAISVPATIVEQDSPVASMERSMELTKGFAGQVFLLLLLVWVIEMVVAGVLQMPGAIFTMLAVMAKHQPSVGVTVYTYISQFLSQVLVGPIGTISASLMYYNLRVRKEGFDIQHLMNTLDNLPQPPLADLPVAQ